MAAVTRVEARDADDNLVGLVTDYTELSWRQRVDSPGAGSVTVPADTQTGDIATLASADRVKIHLDGQLQAGFLLRRDDDGIREGERDASVTVDGQGLQGLLGEALVWVPNWPNLYTTPDTRRFDFTDTYMDPARLNGTLVDQGTQDSPNSDTDWDGNPKGWLVPSAHWLWADDTAGGVAPGRVNIRGDFSTASDQLVALHASADDEADVYVDGIEVASFTGSHRWQETFEYVFTLEAGTHCIAVVGHNLDRPGTNPAGVIVALMGTANGSPDPGNVIIKTDPASGEWAGQGYQATQGMTPGETLRRAIDDAQNRGALSGVSYDFTISGDSDGNAWALAPAINMRPVDTVADLVDRLREHGVDVWMTPDLVVHAAPRRGQDRSGSVFVSLGSEVMRDGLSHKGVRPQTTALLVATQADGWVEKTHANATSVARREGGLEVGSVDDADTADSPAQAAFDQEAVELVETTVDHVATGRVTPLEDFGLGDDISVPKRRSPGDHVSARVLSVRGSVSAQDAEVQWETVASWEAS